MLIVAHEWESVEIKAFLSRKLNKTVLISLNQLYLTIGEVYTNTNRNTRIKIANIFNLN